MDWLLFASSGIPGPYLGMFTGEAGPPKPGVWHDPTTCDGIAAHDVELAFAAVYHQRLAASASKEVLFAMEMMVDHKRPDGTIYPQDIKRGLEHQRIAYYEAMTARLHLFALLDRGHGAR